MAIAMTKTAPRQEENDDHRVGGLCSAFCVAEQSEQEAYDEANLTFEYVSVTEDPDHIETCKDRHKKCLMFVST